MMIRRNVLLWASVALLLFFAFVLMPIHERFKGADGRETDVSPDAPPTPEWLKPTDPRTNKKQ